MTALALWGGNLTYCILRLKVLPRYWLLKANKAFCQVNHFTLLRVQKKSRSDVFPSHLLTRTNTGLGVQLPQLDYHMKDKESVLICARSSFVHLVDEALFLGLQLPILVVQNLRSRGPGR